MRTNGLIMLAACAVLSTSCGQGDHRPVGTEATLPRIEKEGPEHTAGDEGQTDPQSVDLALSGMELETAVAADASPTDAGGPIQPVAPESPTSHYAQLEQSRRIWTDLKAKCGGNYSYKVTWSSWVGFGHETEMVVRNNQVAERRYREWNAQSGPVAGPVELGAVPEPEGEAWTEQGEQLGGHEKGAPPRTLDELYEEAAKTLAEKLDPHHRLYLRFDDRGLLLSCFYVDTTIADDAPRRGIVIDRIEFLSIDE